MLAILFWTVSPALRTGAVYVPDAYWNPVWEAEIDIDGNEIPEPCRVAVKSGKVRVIKSGKVLLIWKELERRGVKEDGRHGGFAGRRFEEEDVAVVEDATEDA